MVNRWFLVGYSLLTRWLLVKINHSQALVLNKASVLHRITLVGQTHSSQFMEWVNLGITALKHATCSPNAFLNIFRIPNNYQFYLSNFLKFCDNISHKLFRPTQFLKEIMKILECPICRNKSGPSPYSMLQQIERVATSKLAPRNFLRYLQSTLIMR